MASNHSETNNMRRVTFFVFPVLLFLSSNAFPQRVDELAAYNEPPSRLRGVIEKFGEDYGSIDRFYTARTSQNRIARFRLEALFNPE